MTKRADKAREARWAEGGHGRLTMRITRAANNALDRLAVKHGCTRRDAVEALLLGNIRAPQNPHGLSDAEMAIAADMGVSL